MSEEKSSGLTHIEAKIVPGHGIASGKTKDRRFPAGTISQQMPHFESEGFSGKSFHQGTLNLDVSPYSFILGIPSYQFSQVKWCEYLPPENFSFFPAVSSIHWMITAKSTQAMFTGLTLRPNLALSNPLVC
jgi:hypothetical protein